MNKTLIKFAFLVVAILIVGVVAYTLVSPRVDTVTVHDAAIKNVQTLVRMQSMEIYDEVPVKGSIGKRHLVGRLRLRGNVGFDIDKIDMDLDADTVRVTLPAEVIEVYESTDEGSYIVFDTWNDSFLGKSNFTAQEENVIKSKVKGNWINHLYANGTIDHARAEAAQNLQTMLTLTLRKPVIVDKGKALK